MCLSTHIPHGFHGNLNARQSKEVAFMPRQKVTGIGVCSFLSLKACGFNTHTVYNTQHLDYNPLTIQKTLKPQYTIQHSIHHRIHIYCIHCSTNSILTTHSMIDNMCVHTHNALHTQI